MKIRIKQLFISFVCLILIFIVSLPFVLPWAVNTNFVKSELATAVKQKSGVELDPSKFSITLFPQPGVTVRDLAFQPDDAIKVLIKSFTLTIDLEELLSGEIALGKVVIDQPDIQTFLDRGTPPQKTEPPEPFKISLPAVFDLISRAISMIPGDSDTIEVIFKNGSSQFFDKATGSLKISKTRKKVIFNTLLEKINISPSELLGSDFSKYVNLDTVQIKQILIDSTLDASDSGRWLKGQCRIIGPELAATDKTVLLQTDKIDLNFNVTPDQQQISIPPASLSYPEGIVGVELLNHPSKEKARLAFSGKDVNVDQAREMTLPLLRNIYVPQVLFEILLGGTVPQIDVWLESDGLNTLLDEHNLKISGNIINGKVHIPETELIVSQVNGRVTLADGVLNVISPNGMLETSKIKTGTLAVDLLNYEDEPFKGTFDLDIDLSMLPRTLISLVPDTLLAEELANVSKVQGRCSGVLDLEMKTGSDEPTVHVKTEQFSARGYYSRIPGEILIDSARVTYKPDFIFLDSVNGMVNENIIKNLSCSVALEDDPFVDIEKGSATLNIETLIPWLMTYEETRKAISPITYGGGTVDISSITLSGPVLTPENWKYEIKGSPNSVFISTLKNEKQIEELSCNLSVSEKQIQFRNLKAKHNSLPILAEILPAEYSESIRTPFQLDNARFSSEATSSLFNAKIIFDSGPYLHIDLSGKDRSSLELNAARFIDKEISDASISFPHKKNKPLFDFSGRLNTVSVKKILKPGSPLDKKIDQITGGQPVRIYSDKTGALNIIIQELNADFLVDSKLDGTPMKTTILTDDPINFKADKLKFKDLLFTDVDTKISFKDNHSYVRLKSASLCDLKIKGYINLKDGKIYANIPIEAKDQENIQPLLSCLLEKEKFMNGSYSFSTNLYSSGVPSSEVINKIAGDLKINARDGRIYKMTLLSRILSVLNVSNVFRGRIPNITQEGFAYTTIDIQADIKESIIHLKHAVIDGHDMTMIFSGEIDPVNDKIDLTCLVAPFKTVDIIIEKIPIINTLLGGRLVSVPVKASGNLSDPVVIPLHPSAVGEGLVDMMSRIVKSPITLWEKMVGEE